MRYVGIKGKVWECVKAAMRRLYKDCYTCPATNLQGQNAQAGHYRPVAIVGANNTRAWDSRFIKLQCGRCNGAGQGEQVIFRRRLIEELGEETVAEYDRLVAAKHVSPVKNWPAIMDHFNSL